MTRAELRALVEAATPGPWRVVPQSPEWFNVESDAMPGQVAEAIEFGSDARLIAAARTALPELLDALDRVDLALGQLDAESAAIHLSNAERNLAHHIIDRVRRALAGPNEGGT